LSDSIRVLVVDDIAETREHIAKLLAFEPDMELVGAAAGGAEALDVATQVQPDVVLMDVNMPGMDGIETSERLARTAPNAAVVMMSVQNEAEYLRRSMLAGAREFLVKPFTSDELFGSVRQVHSRQRETRLQRIPVGPGIGTEGLRPERHGQVVAVFSPKGGVGTTTLATNLAVAAATDLHQAVALVDADFQFGDVGLMLNINPNNAATIADILADLADGNGDAVDSALTAHPSGVQVLLPPPSPEMAELVSADHMRRVLSRLRQTADLVVVDCVSQLHDPSLTALDAADVVLIVLTFDLASIKATRVFLRVAERLGYSDERLRIVLNKADSVHNITLADVEGSIGRKVDYIVGSDARTAIHAMNNGAPFVAANANAQISRDVIAIARAVGATEGAAKAASAPAPQSRLSRPAIFARR
jgi:pilus assembly protein CpaE